jgi:ABC-type phosphate transport system substrate-binding protein
VPELKGLTLVLNFDTIAAILLNQITLWNDDRIKAINTDEVAAALPAQSIIVVTSKDSSALEQLYTYMLSAQSAEFNATVGVGSNVTFPVESAGANRSIITDADNTLTTLKQNKYSFAFWWYHEVLLVRHIVQSPR